MEQTKNDRKYYRCFEGHKWVRRNDAWERKVKEFVRFQPCPDCGEKLYRYWAQYDVKGRLNRHVKCKNGHKHTELNGKLSTRKLKIQSAPKPRKAAAITLENIILTCMNWSSPSTKNSEGEWRDSLTRVFSMAPSIVHQKAWD